MVKIKFVNFAKLRILSKDSRNRKLIIAVLLIIVGLAIYFFLQYQKTQALLKNPSQVSTAEIETLVNQVGKLIVLPVGESPTIATVSDKTKLQDQPFFNNAQNGDKVLIYSNAKKAILYRPSINKIIEVAPVNIASDSNLQVNTSPSVTPQPKNLRVAIYNGTNVPGLAANAAAKLNEKLDNIEVVGKADASNEYQSTLVIDISGTNAKALGQFTDIVGGKIEVSVPSGEANPDADILIIVGADYENK